jgi:hypothetical protein
LGASLGVARASVRLRIVLRFERLRGRIRDGGRRSDASYVDEYGDAAEHDERAHGSALRAGNETPWIVVSG